MKQRIVKLFCILNCFRDWGFSLVLKGTSRFRLFVVLSPFTCKYCFNEQAISASTTSFTVQLWYFDAFLRVFIEKGLQMAFYLQPTMFTTLPLM